MKQKMGKGKVAILSIFGFLIGGFVFFFGYDTWADAAWLARETRSTVERVQNVAIVEMAFGGFLLVATLVCLWAWME